MDSTTLYYLIFAVIDAILLIPLFLVWRSNALAWRAISPGWRYFPATGASLVTMIATAVWAFMAWYAHDAWEVAMDASRPKPPFEVIWCVALFAFGIALSVAGPLNSIARGRGPQP